MNRSEKLLLAASGGLVLLAGGVLALGRRVPTPEQGAVAAAPLRSLIDRLDAYVQHQFATVEGMGISRISMGPHGIWSLMPGPEPKSIAEALEASKVRAYFRTVSLKRGAYTWGTPVIPAFEARTRINVLVRFDTREQADNAMKNSPDIYRDLREVDPSTHHQSLSKPVRIALDHIGEEKTPDLPELRAGIGKSIFVLKAARSHTFRSGQWEVTARPIKASKQKCLSCHSDAQGKPARLNDTLGLALYVTRQKQPGARLAALSP